jgi:hypothetical protein
MSLLNICNFPTFSVYLVAYDGIAGQREEGGVLFGLVTALLYLPLLGGHFTLLKPV